VNVLLVEDDPTLGPLLKRALESQAHSVALVASFEDARRASLEGVELAVVDWMLPDGDGLDLVTHFRRLSFHEPVLMLTARGETRDRINALDAGVDDYLVKPFDMDELLARVRALGRRGTRGVGIEVGPLYIDIWRRNVFVGGKLLDPFTTIELDVLVYLARRPNRPVARSELIDMIWEGNESSSSALSVAVFRLRQKLGDYSWLVETVRRGGYRLRTEPGPP
jgi:DNA-binding response OmpR family regulator